jgi:predicted nucleic acid-binding protein
MSLVFWDTMLFIYLIEEHPTLRPRVREIRSRMLERRDQLVTSALALGELLSGPSVRADAAVATRYRNAIAPPYCEVLPFTSETAEHFAEIRQDRTIQPADAIQLACAAKAKVDLFLTHDRRLAKKTIPGIQFIADLNFDYL